MKHPVLVVALLLVVANADAASLTLNVTVPANTPPADTIYVAGDFQGWNPGSPAYALSPQPNQTWQIVLTLPDNTPIQFKFTRGDWSRVEKGPSGEEIANRTHTPVGTQTLNLTVANWADIQPSTITGHVESFQFAPFLSGRRIWVYLPPDYFEPDQSNAHYPVLYMHDGQNLFDDATSFAGEWHADEAAETLIAGAEIEPIIIVGIENGPARCDEYTPYADGSLPCTGGGGEAYLQAIRDVLIPEVNARYRTRTGPDNTSMCGSSLGGLISAYAGYAHADTWGRVAAVSPSYWANQQLFTFATQTGRPATLARFYQDMGTSEGASNITHLRTMRDIALAQGFVLDDDLKHVEAAGASHNEFFWSLRFPDILRFLIDATPPPPACPADLDGDDDTDVFDFAVMAASFGTSVTPGTGADLDGDGVVSVFDFALFAAGFGCPN